jgi:hypothetical protein
MALNEVLDSLCDDVSVARKASCCDGVRGDVDML